MSNANIKQVLDRIEQSLEAASRSKDVLAAAMLAKNYGKPLVYDNRASYIGGAILLLIGVGILGRSVGLSIMYFGLYELESILIGMLMSPFVILPAGCIIAGSVLIYKTRKRSKGSGALAKKLFFLDSIFDNNLEKLPCPPVEELKREFTTFDRGNSSRNIRLFIKGAHKAKQDSFDYNYFHFQYVSTRSESYSTKDSSGNYVTRTRTVYDHGDHFGLIIDFPFFKEIHVTRGQGYVHRYKGEWASSSVEFSNEFVGSAADQKDLHAFMTPAVISVLNSLAESLSSLSVEISSKGRLCLSFSSGDVLSGDQTYDFSQPKEFYEELCGRTDLKKLETTVSSLQKLIKASNKKR